MSSISAFVIEGDKEAGVVPEYPGIHPRVEFTFKPVTTAERYRFQKGADVLEPEAKAKREAEFVASRLESWSLTEGRPTVKQVESLKPRLFDLLSAKVLGYIPPGEVQPS